MTSKTALTLVLSLAVLALSACGFSPVYGTYAGSGKNGSVASSLDKIYIDSIPDRSGQKLRNTLMDRFYQTGRKNLADAQYRLRVTALSESIYGTGIAKDATATRSQIKLYGVFTLTRVGDVEGKRLIARSIQAISSFDTLASEYTTLVTQEDARDQVIRDMADQIATMLELYFTDPSKFPSPDDVKVEDAEPVLTHDPRAYITDQLKGY